MGRFLVAPGVDEFDEQVFLSYVEQVAKLFSSFGARILQFLPASP
ncbi:MAG TPA: hypothetical protein VFV92_11150 [Candidatus Bathyarchaeia archaeon]|nr:hypothetical protein [Candidatus Bathyarchaeia archaeon]